MRDKHKDQIRARRVINCRSLASQFHGVVGSARYYEGLIEDLSP